MSTATTASVSTHILDTSIGRPAEGVAISLAARSGSENRVCPSQSFGSHTSRSSGATLKSPQTTSRSSVRWRSSSHRRNRPYQASFWW